jgi:predicted anti-sigma-YlaC factor YlaD
MTCNEARELMPDLAAGLAAATPEVKAHLDSCLECAGKLEAFRQTMSLLDEWQAPEPSPYFDVRLRARWREESAKQPVNWLRWLRKPALAASFALLMVVSVTLVRMNNGRMNNGHSSDNGSASIPALVALAPQTPVEPGTAVGDLQALEKNQNLYSDFELLDDLEVQQDVTANP